MDNLVVHQIFLQTGSCRTATNSWILMAKIINKVKLWSTLVNSLWYTYFPFNSRNIENKKWNINFSWIYFESDFVLLKAISQDWQVELCISMYYFLHLQEKNICLNIVFKNIKASIFNSNIISKYITTAVVFNRVDLYVFMKECKS